jgi:hypothetical protein
MLTSFDKYRPKIADNKLRQSAINLLKRRQEFGDTMIDQVGINMNNHLEAPSLSPVAQDTSNQIKAHDYGGGASYGGSPSTEPVNQPGQPQINANNYLDTPSLDTTGLQGIAEAVKQSGSYAKNPYDRSDVIYRKRAETPEEYGFDPQRDDPNSKYNRGRKLIQGLVALNGVVGGYQNTAAQAKHVAEGGTAGRPVDYVSSTLDRMSDIDANAAAEMEKYRRLALEGKLYNIGLDNKAAADDFARGRQDQLRGEDREFQLGRDKARGEAEAAKEAQRQKELADKIEREEKNNKANRNLKREISGNKNSNSGTRISIGGEEFGSNDLMRDYFKHKQETDKGDELGNSPELDWHKEASSWKHPDHSPEDAIHFKNALEWKKEKVFQSKADGYLKKALDVNSIPKDVVDQWMQARGVDELTARNLISQFKIEQAIPSFADHYGLDQETAAREVQKIAYQIASGVGPDEVDATNQKIEEVSGVKNNRLESYRADMSKKIESIMSSVNLNKGQEREIKQLSTPEEKAMRIIQYYESGQLPEPEELDMPDGLPGTDRHSRYASSVFNTKSLTEGTIGQLKRSLEDINRDDLKTDPVKGTYSNIKAIYTPSE